MNLVINAQDAIEGKGHITIEASHVKLDEEYARQHVPLKSGAYSMLVVIDSGCGMDKETIAKIFEPFYTTKEFGKGTGLGLSTVYGLVKQHDGSVWVYSEIGRGSAFKIFFPEVTAEPVPEALPIVDAACYQGSGTVLLVEDDEMLLGLVRTLLSERGFTVLPASDPRHALELCENTPLDLLVSDVIMPEMTGPEFYRKLSRTHPGLKVLYMSGYTNTIVGRLGVLDKGVNFIQKPFSVNEFLNAVGKTLADH